MGAEYRILPWYAHARALRDSAGGSHHRKQSQAGALLLHGESILRTYRIALGRNPVGRKTEQGDGKTPEGRYSIDRRNPQSSCHLSLHISYPNDSDRGQVRERGVEPGGDVMIHGLRNGEGHIGRAHLETDWTQGCVAVTDDEMEEIWGLVEDGTPIEINP
ncbi:MAG: L,D-transpeptidase family protein [Acidobacteriia bacterium]|nr:L,D-transpeptidase family protein [Terriglobia bacterium]